MSLASPVLDVAPIGRAREQAILRAHLAGVVAGRGSLVWVAGEAGIGKTTLVDWLAGEARTQGVTVVAGHCYDLTPRPPYGPWREAFANPGLAGEAGNPLRRDADLADVASQEALFVRVHAFVATMTANRPLLLVLEDLHWAEPATLDLLRSLARGIEALPLLLVATYRADELSRQHPLAQLLPLMVREAKAARIDLQPFTSEDLATLVNGRYPLARGDFRRLMSYLQARTAGNPFYLMEMLRTLESERLLWSAEGTWRLERLDEAPVPTLVQHVIERRLATLEASNRHLLEVAAVIGQQVPLDVWRLASGEADERLIPAMEEAIARNLMRAEPGRVSSRFAHALVRDTLYHGLPILRRRELHRRVAEVLSDRPDPPASDIASHFVSADDARAITWLIRAGEQALALYAARDAVAALDQAQELASRFGQAVPAAAYGVRATAHTLLGDFDRARHDFELVLEAGRAAEEPAVAWQALLDLGMLWAERDYERTGEYYRAALYLAHEVGDASMIARSLDHIGNWHVNIDEPDLAIPLHQEALRRSEASGDRAGMAASLDFLGMAAFLNGDLPASTAYCERAITLHRALGNRQRLVTCLGTLTFNGGAPDIIATPMYREASYWLRAGEEALAIARDMGWAAGEAWTLFALNWVRTSQGDLGRALADADAALDIATRIGHVQWTIAAHYAASGVWRELLDSARTTTSLEAGLSLARGTGSGFWTNTMAATLASHLIAVGDVGAAAAILEPLIPLGAIRPTRWRKYLAVQAELELARDRPDRALDIIDQLLALPPTFPLERTSPLLVKLRADTLRRLSRPDEAEAAYHAARQAAELFGFSPLRWRIDLAHGELYRAEGEAAKAIAAFQRARDTVAELAASIPDDELRRGFHQRALSLIPDAVADVRAAGLSARELDVLRLLVEGLSDREIGEALSISPRTVMRHVTGILNKLGVSSRTAAASQAIRQGLV